MQEPFLIAKLDSAEKTWKELSVRLADPDITSNPTEYQKLAQSVAELDVVITSYLFLSFLPPSNFYIYSFLFIILLQFLP